MPERRSAYTKVDLLTITLPQVVSALIRHARWRRNYYIPITVSATTAVIDAMFCEAERISTPYYWKRVRGLLRRQLPHEDCARYDYVVWMSMPESHQDCRR